MSLRSYIKDVARSLFFDNETNGFVADNIQEAIEELSETVSTSASPGFSFGRASNVNSGTWLQCETVPSNKAGRFVYITGAVVEKIFISNETISTFDISIYHHDGNEINLTLVDTVTVTASRGGSFTISQSVPTNKQLALRVTSGSARNLVCGLELSGSN